MKATRQYKNEKTGIEYERTPKIDPENLNFAFGTRRVHIVVDIAEYAQKYAGWKNEDGTWEIEPSIDWYASARVACGHYRSATGRITFDQYNGAEKDAKIWNDRPEMRCEHCVAMLRVANRKNTN
jgi:hypothetical protein